ncbi:MAG: hypothetical protein H6707_19955 [Deltaproteobacteria bacterium]|nr:hypothetical protein [Deltaproteobacteria bacterium]
MQFHRFRSVVLTVSLSLCVSLNANARVNPLRLMTGSVKNSRADVIVVMDVSKSVSQDASGIAGAGCSGDRSVGGSQASQVDVCGDGACFGAEDNGSCPADCQKSATEDQPLFVSNCNNNPDVSGSRLVRLKRAISTVIPEFRTMANFSLVTYPEHTGYFSYHPAAAGGLVKIKGKWVTVTPAKDLVSIRLSEWELRAGGWIDGAGWNSSSDSPAASFTRNGVVYTRLDGVASLTHPTVSGAYAHEYRRTADGGDVIYRRAPWNGAVYNDGTYDWTYAATYYSYEQPEINSGSTTVSASYKGPMYVSGGTTYVFHKYRDSNEALSEALQGKLFMPLIESSDQDDHDANVGLLMNRLSDPWNGGIGTEGSGNAAPAKQAMEVAQQHLIARANGTAPFTTADGLIACRKRFIIYLTDGKYSPKSASYEPSDVLKSIYSDFPSTADNPIKTYVIGTFVSSADLSTVQTWANIGQTGDPNETAALLTASNEAELVDTLRQTIINALEGDFTTMAPGVTSAEGSSSELDQNVVLIPSVEYPHWKGHLRAVKIDVKPSVELWDAGQILANTAYNERKFFSGTPSSASGKPVLVFTNTGSAINVNVSAIRAMWPAAPARPAPAADAEIIGMVEWLAGKDRDWKLGTIVNTVPAIIGRPPRLESAPGHNAFEVAHLAREKLVYIVSNEGGLHAFRSSDGSEAFVHSAGDVAQAVLRGLQKRWPIPRPARIRLGAGDLAARDGCPRWHRHRREQLVDPTGADDGRRRRALQRARRHRSVGLQQRALRTQHLPV